MSIDKETARRVAHLARIEVAEADLGPLAAELSGILGFMEQLNEVDVEGVEPMTSVTPMRLPWREDVVTDGGDPRPRARERAGRPGRLLHRAEGGRVDADLAALTIAEARDRLRSRRHSARSSSTEACLAAAEAAGALNAVLGADAGSRAAPGGRWPRRGCKRGDAPDLCGVPLGIKDLFCVEGEPTQAASRILEGFRPPYESTVTRQLWDAGAVCIGKLNMDEFAMGSSNETSVYGPAVSPWRRRRRHRGADARRLVGRLGRGGGGATSASARPAPTPAARSASRPRFTGIVGVKPTYGRCSRWGIVAFASSLDQAGPMAKTVRDAAIMLEGDGRTRPEGFDLGRPAGAGLRGGARAATCAASASASRRSTGSTACRPRSRRSGRRAPTGCATPAPRSSNLAAAHPVRAAGLLRDRARPRPRRTSRATTACATGGGRGSAPTRASPRCTSAPAPRASAPRCGGG